MAIGKRENSYAFNVLTNDQMETLLAVNRPTVAIPRKKAVHTPWLTLDDHLYLVVGIPAYYAFYHRRGA